MQSSEVLRCFYPLSWWQSSSSYVAPYFFLSKQTNVGFSIDLIHRGSPESPLYNPNLSHFERQDITFQRSLKPSQQIGTTSLIPDAGEYLLKISFPNFFFGCGHDNGGIFPHKGVGAIVFGPQLYSFLSQLSSLHHGKFSFCLAPATATPSRISFGDQAVVSGPGVVSTPLILDAHCHVMLQGVTVGSKKLRHFPNQLYFLSNNARKMNGGRILIGSGTTFTFLPSPLQLQVKGMVRRQIRLKPVANPQRPFTLCYSSASKNADIPKITFHFMGADVELSPLNTFVVNSPTSLCLAILPTRDVLVLGNFAQTNFLVGYDLLKKLVSFKQIDCTKY